MPETPALIIENIKKANGGYILRIAEALGLTTTIHTRYNYGALVNMEAVYIVTYEARAVEGTTITYNVLLKAPRPIGTIKLQHEYKDRESRTMAQEMYTWANKRGLLERLDVQHQPIYAEMELARDHYLRNPKRYARYDRLEVVERVKTLIKDADTLQANGVRFHPTYNGKYDNKESNLKYTTPASKDIETEDRPYRLKASQITADGDLKDSQLTRVMEAEANNDLYDTITANDYPETGIKVWVDSVAVQVALRERHIAEFFLYFAIVSFLKKNHKYPNCRVRDVVDFLRGFLRNRKLAEASKAVVWRLIKAGFMTTSERFPDGRGLSLNAHLSIRSQARYVAKWDGAWLGRNRQHRGFRRIKHLVNKKNLTYADESYTDLGGISKLGKASVIREKLESVVRPYFDIYATKTTQLDTGFIHLINSGVHEMKRFLYELAITSWDYPICRTRVMYNLLISASAQRQYERTNTHLAKRYNYLELPEDMLDAMTPYAKRMVYTNLNKGKFRRSRNGRIYRQEGNSYKSDRIVWRASKRCSRLRLSPYHIKMWQFARPVFKGDQGSTPTPTFRRIPDRMMHGQPLPITYITSKSKVQKGNYFALHQDGVGVITSDYHQWDLFEPLLRYDRNGDVRIPQDASITSHAQTWRSRDSLEVTDTPSVLDWLSKSIPPIQRNRHNQHQVVH